MPHLHLPNLIARQRRFIILIAFLLLVVGEVPVRADSVSWGGSSLNSHIEYVGSVFDDTLNFPGSTPPGGYSTSVSVGSSSAAGTYVFADSGFTASLTSSAANSGSANLAENDGFVFFTANADMTFSLTDSFSGSGPSSSASWGPSLYDVTDSTYLIGPINEEQDNISGSFSFGPLLSSASLNAGDEYKLEYFSSVSPPNGSTNGGISGTENVSLTFITPVIAPLPSAAWAGLILLLSAMLAPRWLRSVARRD